MKRLVMGIVLITTGLLSLRFYPGTGYGDLDTIFKTCAIILSAMGLLIAVQGVRPWSPPENPRNKSE